MGHYAKALPVVDVPGQLFTVFKVSSIEQGRRQNTHSSEGEGGGGDGGRVMASSSSLRWGAEDCGTCAWWMDGVACAEAGLGRWARLGRCGTICGLRALESSLEDIAFLREETERGDHDHIRVGAAA